ncbi:MAG: hypothetical protein GFH27_549313n104 [Chloroflexi bacterium AL-W]|nr:hypothetical protein [Chloroflexi bacterium AL-N1]NOK69527.1 hypothetical protein [Chloroflexi bacterium AL-N10]NOK77492.1 hypothetical protein [Chloroflexi bacterium AL-N5]NOK84343.1 hypothetical protein [Chloroflexi bacterium AL-W]NOK91491.1 hypothetical protein [Chloroflexi bacterium AL-N15]
MISRHSMLAARYILIAVAISAVTILAYNSITLRRILVSYSPIAWVTGNSTAGNVTEYFEEIPMVSFAEAQQHVSFAIPLPSHLPDSMELKGARVRHNDDSVSVVYGPTTPQSGFGMGFSVQPGTGIGGSQYVFPEHAKQETTVNGNPAVCVEGAWSPLNQWQPNSDAIHLGWSDGTLSYHLGGSGLQLDCDEAVKIAESIS